MSTSDERRAAILAIRESIYRMATQREYKAPAKSPAELVAAVLQIADNRDIEVATMLCGVPAVARAVWPSRHVFRLAEFIAAVPPELLEELANVRRSADWTTWRAFAAEQRALERADAARAYREDVLQGAEEPAPVEEHVAA